MKILVWGNPVVEPAVVEGERDVVVDAERARNALFPPRVRPDAGQPKSFGLVPRVLNRVVDGVEADHALVDVGAGMVHAVVVEPEEGLHLPGIATRGPVEVEVVTKLPWLVGAWLVVWIAVTLRRRMAIVQVGEERPVRSPEVLAIEVQRILVQVILEAHETGSPILGVDPRPGERPVEAVDGAARETPGTANAVRRRHVLAERVDRLHQRRGEGMLVQLQVNLVIDGIRQSQRTGPDLMRPSVRVLLADARAGRGEDAGPGVSPGTGVRRGIHRRDGKQILERIEDQRTGRKWLVTHVTQREGRGRTQRFCFD